MVAGSSLNSSLVSYQHARRSEGAPVPAHKFSQASWKYSHGCGENVVGQAFCWGNSKRRVPALRAPKSSSLELPVKQCPTEALVPDFAKAEARHEEDGFACCGRRSVTNCTLSRPRAQGIRPHHFPDASAARCTSTQLAKPPELRITNLSSACLAPHSRRNGTCRQSWMPFVRPRISFWSHGCYLFVLSHVSDGWGHIGKRTVKCGAEKVTPPWTVLFDLRERESSWTPANQVWLQTVHMSLDYCTQLLSFET
jgi:hypothetical protein